MLLTKKTSGTSAATSSPFLHSLRRGLSQALPTLDRRSFLRRLHGVLAHFVWPRHWPACFWRAKFSGVDSANASARPD
jgi:hypothetical protein